jgi:hypothetical protein
VIGSSSRNCGCSPRAHWGRGDLVCIGQLAGVVPPAGRWRLEHRQQPLGGRAAGSRGGRKKNWLLVGSDKDGGTLAVLFSMTASRGRHGVVADILRRLPTAPPDRLAELLPDVSFSGASERGQKTGRIACNLPGSRPRIGAVPLDGYRKSQLPREYEMMDTNRRHSSLAAKLNAVLFLLSVQTLLAGEQALASVEESRVLERIENNWRARQQRVKLFHFVSSTRVTIPKEFFKEHRGESGRTEVRDEHYDTPRHQLWVDGNDKMRTDGMKFNPNRPKSTNQTIVSQGPRESRVIHGKSEKQLTTFPNPNEIAFGQVFKGTERESWRRTRGVSHPVLALYRSFPAWNDPTPLKWRVVTTNAIINNSHYIKIESTYPRAGACEELWVDPRRDDLIVQRLLKSGDKLTVTSIEYRPDKTAGWVPTRWTVKYTLAGIPQAIWETTVVDYSINQPIPAGTFDLAFPPRTFVTDAVSNEHYLVRADGSKRPVTNRELELQRQRKLRFGDLLKETGSPPEKGAN